MSIDTIRDTADIVIPNTDLCGPDDPIWHEQRRQGLGGSDAAAAIGLSPWDTPYSVWAMKVGEVGAKEATNPMIWGQRLEQAIGLGFSTDTGVEVTRYPVMLRSREHPFMQVNVDFLTADDAVVECKNVGIRQSDEWEDGNVPTHYMIQGQHELAVTGLDRVWFACLVGGQDPRYIEVERDQNVIDMLIEQEAAFWDLVERQVPPALDGTEATTRALKEQYRDVEEGNIELDESVVMPLLHERKRLKAVAKDVKTAVDGVENDIKALLGHKEIGTINGVTVVTWKRSEIAGHYVEPFTRRTINVPKGVLPE